VTPRFRKSSGKAAVGGDGGMRWMVGSRLLERSASSSPHLPRLRSRSMERIAEEKSSKKHLHNVTGIEFMFILTYYLFSVM